MRSFFITLGLVVVLGLSLFACNKGGAQQQQQTGAAPTAAAALDGAAIYAKANCAMCHGIDRGGKPMGPALLTLKQNWTVDKLAEYLADPEGFAANDSRLTAQKQQFSMKMPAPNITKEERDTLAKWLLGQ